MEGFIVLFDVFLRNVNLLNILRVSCSETRLTIYRALYIQKHSAGAKGCLGQRLSILWRRKNRKCFKPSIKFRKRSGHLIECICVQIMAEVIYCKF